MFLVEVIVHFIRGIVNVLDLVIKLQIKLIFGDFKLLRELFNLYLELVHSQIAVREHILVFCLAFIVEHHVEIQFFVFFVAVVFVPLHISLELFCFFLRFFTVIGEVIGHDWTPLFQFVDSSLQCRKVCCLSVYPLLYRATRIEEVPELLKLFYRKEPCFMFVCCN